MKRIVLIVMLTLPALLLADIGTVKTSFPLAFDQPFGMARNNDVFLISDRASGLLYHFSIKEGKITASQSLPCSHPWGIAKSNSGLWISDRENQRILHYQLESKRVDFVLSDVETDASGLAWDGESLWATSGDTFLRLDPTDGTELQTFTGPGRDTTAIFFDGTYFWLSERLKDHIVCATPAGEIIGVLPSPGPYPAGLCRWGDTLWVLDFQERVLYGLDIAANAKPYYLGKPHRREVNFNHALTNQGPSNDVTARIYLCVGQEDPHQKLLETYLYSPPGVSFTRDNWDQEFALLMGAIPAMQTLELGYRVKIETRDLNYFILPEAVKPLQSIPPDIRRRYLADGHKLKLKAPYIKELVKKIVGDETNPFWIAFRIHKYLHLNMEYVRTGGWNAAPTVLKRGNGSCSEFTFSFIALARAAGLPARYEAGLVVRGDDGSLDRVYHRWVQVYLPPYGWIPVDPSRGKPATAMDVATSFGSLSHRFFITTHSGGDSPLLGWTYNYSSFYEFSGQAVVKERTEAKWYPVIEKNTAGRAGS
jgi:transglutaminase-like putative cysteine protease